MQQRFKIVHWNENNPPIAFESPCFPVRKQNNNWPRHHASRLAGRQMHAALERRFSPDVLSSPIDISVSRCQRRLALSKCPAKTWSVENNSTLSHTHTRMQFKFGWNGFLAWFCRKRWYDARSNDLFCCVYESYIYPLILAVLGDSFSVQSINVFSCLTLFCKFSSDNATKKICARGRAK